MQTSSRPRHGRARAAVAAVVLVLTAFSLGAAAPSALAGGFTVKVSSPQTVYVGRPAVIKVTGTIPRQYMRFLYWVTVASIRTSVMSHCPANSWDAAQVANATEGAVLVLASRAVPDPSGRFVVPVGIRPYEPGRARICAYTYDGEATTLARAARMVTVKRR